MESLALLSIRTKSFCMQKHVYGFSVMPGIFLWIFNNYLLIKKGGRLISILPTYTIKRFCMTSLQENKSGIFPF